MEKYSTWRDPGTGIHPFIESKGNGKPGINLIIALLKAPFILIVSLWYLFISFVVSLIPIPIVQQFFRRYSDVLGCRALLYLLGFWNISTRIVSFKKASKTGTFNATGGDIILSNHISYADILYLSFRFSPIYVFPVSQFTDVKAAGVPFYSATGAIQQTISDNKLTDKNSVPLSKIIEEGKRSGRPIILFIEGTTTNGKLLLSTYPILDQLSASVKYHVLAFKYEYENLNPAFTIGNAYSHLMYLSAQLYNKLEVRYIADEDIDTEVLNAESKTNQLTSLILQIAKIRKSQFTVKDKLEFRDYFYNYKKTY